MMASVLHKYHVKLLVWKENEKVSSCQSRFRADRDHCGGSIFKLAPNWSLVLADVWPEVWVVSVPFHCLSDAFSPGHFSSPAQLLQLLTLDGVTQVDPRPGEQRSKVKSVLLRSRCQKTEILRAKAKVDGFGYFLEFSPAFASSFSTYLSGTNSSQSFTSDSGTFLTILTSSLASWMMGISQLVPTL